VRNDYLVTLEKLRALQSFRTALGASASNNFYAISQRRLYRQVNLWKTYLPKIHPYYAVKCNPDKNILSWLSEEDFGFDCASAREVNIIKDIDRGSTVLFANPCKKIEDIENAQKQNIRETVIDSREEIDKLARMDWKGGSLVRIRVEDSGSLMPFSSKFGVDLYTVKNLAKYAKERGQNLNGISFHVGSGCEKPSQYEEAIEKSVECITLLRSLGHYASILDIGGGFTNNSFLKTAAMIRKCREKISGNIHMVAEPGRFLAATSQDLFVRVIGKKPMNGDKTGWRYTIDESLYGQFSCIPFDHAKPRWIRIRKQGEAPRPKTPAILYGRTCDSVDHIATAAAAEELEEGDWLWFPHMGAYTTVTSTEFNGFPKPPVVVLKDDKDIQLPDISDIGDDEWPEGLSYVNAVKAPV
jgi:ornithine decarboxylase